MLKALLILRPLVSLNAIGSDPLYLIISIGNKDDGSPEDTAANIITNGEFVDK